MNLSIVTTLYCCKLHVDDFYHRISTAVRKIVDCYDSIYVDDEFSGATLERFAALLSHCRRVSVLAFKLMGCQIWAA